MVSEVTCRVCNPQGLTYPVGRSGLFTGTVAEARAAQWLAPTFPQRHHVCWSCMSWMLAAWNARRQGGIAGIPTFVARLGDRIFGLGDWSFVGDSGLVRQVGLCEVVPVVNEADLPVLTEFRQAFRAQRLTTSSWDEFMEFLDQAVAQFEEMRTKEPGRLPA